MTRATAVFLDRDGVINTKPPAGDYVKTWGEFQFLPGVKDALRLLRQRGLTLILVTNQRGIAKGVMTETALQALHRRMQEELRNAEAQFDAVYYCPHEEGQCSCRKPAIGLFQRALKEFPDIESSIVVGDSEVDVEAAKRLGSQAILIVSDPQTLQTAHQGFAPQS